MSNRLLGVTESRRDLLQRERSREPYFAQNRQHVDVARPAMSGEACFHHAMADPRAVAAEHERHFVERGTAQVEREDPSLLLLAIQARRPRSTGSRGGSVSAGD